MKKNVITKIIILILLIIVFILIWLLKKLDTIPIENSKINIFEEQKEEILEETEIFEEKELHLIFPDYIDYKYLPRLLVLGINKMTFTEKFFNIKRITSNTDFDKDGIDDYTDIYEGAIKYVNTKPIYHSDYYEGGYPPDDVGVCTDVVWNALLNAGYVLKDDVDEDIKNNKNLYPAVGKVPDPNIDFRRVRNLMVYFSRYAKNLTLDINKIEEWQPGDIVTFGETHIGVISKYRNIRGVPLLIHHGGRTPAGQYNVINEKSNISGHYRILDTKKEED